MNRLHMTEQDWMQWLETMPTENEEEWLTDHVIAFKSHKIDYFQALIPVQKFLHSTTEFEQNAILAIGLIQKEEKAQDMLRVAAYKEKRK